LSKEFGALGNLTGSRLLSRYAPMLGRPLEKYYYSRASSPADFFNQNRSDLCSKDFLNRVRRNGDGEFSEHLFAGLPSDTLQRLLYVDTKTWLPDDLLIKADRMTMANSVELRVPFLDHRVLEFAASLPASHKLHCFQTKYVLKRALASRVPKEILDRPKTGFPVPYETWLQRELRSFAWDILTDSRTMGRGYFEPRAIERLLRENSASNNHSKEIFSLITLELWHRTFLDDRKTDVPRAMPDPVRLAGC